MQKITAFMVRPLSFAFLMGILIGSLVYFVGMWSVGPTRQAEDHEVALITHDISQAFRLTQVRGPREKEGRLLQDILNQATQHPHVLSTTVLSRSNEIVAMASKRNVISSERAVVSSQPIKDAGGNIIGTLTMALHENHSRAGDFLVRKVQWTAVLGFLLGFALCVGVLTKANVIVPALKTAFKQVSLGHLDVELPQIKDLEYEELAESFDQMLEGLRERDRMRHSLGRIMDPKIAEILIKENPTVGGLKRQATILFCDIRNYTSLCEELSPDELQDFLNEYWRDTVEIIMEQDGTIDKFHGDGVCVVFGAPMLHDDDPLRAVRTAWQLVGNVQKMNQRRETKRQLPIQIGVGIHTGEVIAGNIGSERRMDYTVVGDVVNVAARIEELNKKFGTQILISDTVYERVEKYVKVKTLTLAHLRGHKRPILIHAVRDVSDITHSAQEEKAA